MTFCSTLFLVAGCAVVAYLLYMNCRRHSDGYSATQPGKKAAAKRCDMQRATPWDANGPLTPLYAYSESSANTVNPNELSGSSKAMNDSMKRATTGINTKIETSSNGRNGSNVFLNNPIINQGGSMPQDEDNAAALGHID